RSWRPLRLGQHLVEEDLRLGLAALLAERDLAHQNVARLGEHPLLTRGQPPLPLPAPQVTDDLRNLDRVAGGQLLQVRLVPPGPVGRFLGVRSAEDVKDLVQALLAHHFPHSDDLGILRRHPYRQIALRDPKDEILLFLALDDPGLDCLDECGPVVGVNNRLADTESHRFETPFAVSRVTRFDLSPPPLVGLFPQVSAATTETRRLPPIASKVKFVRLYH